jgi:hypothetical protein
MRIDSAGNLLVGTTDSNVSNNTGVANSGINLLATGQILAAYGGNTANFNRLGSNGNIVNFDKDGTTVGSIGSYLDAYSYIGSTGGIDTHIAFVNGTVRPSTATGGGLDATLNLGSVGSRFNNLYLSGTVITEAVSTNSLDLQAIAESKSVTAVDVFVYDTSKDSDGGAWRHRTQGTSWYNEALNTSIRGATKKFPSVAVIVGTSTALTIYDGDDPAMPMWMVFNVAAGAYVHTNGNSLKAVSAINGSICWAGYRVGEINFIGDAAEMWESAWHYFSILPISERHGSVYAYGYDQVGTIVHSTTNDVAITVLPNAPIDADTGLPVPTIAVATDGGTSVITDSGNVYDITGFSPVASVDFYGSKLAFSTQVSGSTVYLTVGTSTLSSDIGITSWRDYNGEYNSLGTQGIKLLENMADHLAYGSAIYSAGVNGLTAIDHNEADGSLSMGTIIASDYNTGWMNGDIKLATLSDTDATDVTGSELAVTTSIGTLGAYASSGVMPSDLVEGQTYVIAIDVTAYTSGGLALWKSGVNYTTLGTTAVGSYGITYTHSVDGMQIVGADTIGFTGTATVSVRLAEEDRSVNNNGLQVFGTVTKDPVATGADLVGYTFSSTGYLLAKGSSDITFGTGDFSYSVWFQGGSPNEHILEHWGTTLGGGSRKRYYFSATSQLVIENAGSTTSISSDTYTDSAWHLLNVVRSGGTLKVYVDGYLKNSTASTGNFTSQHDLTVGQRYAESPSSAYAWQGMLALLRISATAPTAEQVAKMYRDEKPLFQEGAQATLYGTSDSVTALAYDDDTELLHAGTSAGRSVFQGLQRVSNTTDAIGVAISASNDLVVEE